MASCLFRALLRSRPVLAAALLSSLLCGCQSLGGLTHELVYGFEPDDYSQLEEKHRKLYQTERSRDSLHWLLANRVRQGMTHADIARVIGEDGTYEENARWLKANSTIYREDDELFRFGPDDRGQSIYLPFREGKLVNFDPRQFTLDMDDSPRPKSI